MGEELLWSVKNGDIALVKDIFGKKKVTKGATKYNINFVWSPPPNFFDQPDPNAELMNGRNALHYAADYGQIEVVDFLISKGADVNVSMQQGEVGNSNKL